MLERENDGVRELERENDGVNGLARENGVGSGSGKGSGVESELVKGTDGAGSESVGVEKAPVVFWAMALVSCASEKASAHDGENEIACGTPALLLAPPLTPRGAHAPSPPRANSSAPLSSSGPPSTASSAAPPSLSCCPSRRLSPCPRARAPAPSLSYLLSRGRSFE